RSRPRRTRQSAGTSRLVFRTNSKRWFVIVTPDLIRGPAPVSAPRSKESGTPGSEAGVTNESGSGSSELVVAREALRRGAARGAAGYLPHVNVLFGARAARLSAHLP